MSEIIIDQAPEWRMPGTLCISTFTCAGHTYTVSTVDYLAHPLASTIVEVQNEIDRKAGLPWEARWWHYETMLFIDGEEAEYPFGDLPGHADIGVYARHQSEAEAQAGHVQFVLRVKRHLLGDSR